MFGVVAGVELELTPTPPEERASLHWSGGARGYWTEGEDFVRYAEWEFSGQIHERGDLKAVLTVWGTHYDQGKRRRHRPTHWALKFTNGRLDQEIARGRCQSIIDAQRLATPLVEANLSAFASWVYRSCNRVSVYRYVPKKSTIMNLVKVEEPSRYGSGMRGWGDPWTRELMKWPENWEPWLTYFETTWGDYKYFPYGHYLFIRTTDGAMHASIQDRDTWSWCGSCDAEITRLARQLPAWHESASNSALSGQSEEVL
jgi:hypothetical protein